MRRIIYIYIAILFNLFVLSETGRAQFTCVDDLYCVNSPDQIFNCPPAGWSPVYWTVHRKGAGGFPAEEITEVMSLVGSDYIFAPSNIPNAFVGIPLVLVCSEGVPGSPMRSTYKTIRIMATPDDAFVLGNSGDACVGAPYKLTLSNSEGNTIEYFLYREDTPTVQRGYALGTGSAVEFSVTHSAAGTYTYFVIAKSANCEVEMTGRPVVTVYENPSASSGHDSPVCPGSDVNLTAAASGGTPAYTYAWTGPGSYASAVQNPTLPAVTNGDAGVYQLTVTDSKGCTDTDNATVVVNSPPTAVISGTAAICKGSDTDLTFTLTGVAPWNLVYTDGTNDYIVSNILTSPHVVTVSPDADMSYTVKSLTDSNTPVCSAASLTGQADISIQARPTAALSGGGAICEGDAATLSVVLSGSADWTITYTDGTSNYTSTATGNPHSIAVSPVTNPAGTSTNYTYLITALSDANCTSLASDLTGSAAVVVNPVPVVALSSDQTDDDFCPGTLVTFTASGADEYIFYKGSVAAANIVRPRSTTATYADDTLIDGDIIIVEGFDTDHAPTTDCSARAQVVVTVHQPPVVAPAFDPACDGDNLNLKANPSAGTPAYTFNWTHASNGYTSTDENPVILTADKAAYDGVYTVEVTDANACKSTGTVNVIMNALPIPAINGNTAVTVTEVCEGSAFTLTASGGTSYTWTLPDGTSYNGAVYTVIDADAGHAGSYTLTVSDGTCDNTLQHSVVVNIPPNPVADNNGPLCVGEQLDLSSTPAGMASYSWSGPASFTGTVQNPTVSAAVTSAMAGVYELTVNDGKCSATAQTTVVVNEVKAVVYV